MSEQSVSSCTQLPLEAYPSMNPLALDLVRGAPNAVRFFGADQTESLQVPDRGRLAVALEMTNREWGNEVGEDLAMWARGEADVIIAGQQVGLGGGPLYTLVKLASLVNYKRRAREEGRRVVAVFWMATEDHDLDEVAQLTLLKDDRLQEIRYTSGNADRMPVGSMLVPEEARRRLVELTELPEEGWLEPGLTMRDSFARLVAHVAGGEVVLVDSLLPELRTAGKTFFERASTKLEEIQSAISRRSRELDQAGYRAQVQAGPSGDYTLFYEIESGGARRRIESAERLSSLAGAVPESISTAALMRPLLQDVVFAPEAFVGGPAEVAYYAQLGPVYELLSIRQPRVLLRAHTLVLPEKLIRSVERHEIEPEEWLDAPEAILSRREKDRERRLSERIAKLRKNVESEVTEIRSSILDADPSMTRSLNRTIRRIDYHLETLDRRGRRVISRSDVERLAAVERFANVIRPGGVVQDRFVGWLGFWLIWGDALFDSLVQHSAPGEDRLTIIGIS